MTERTEVCSSCDAIDKLLTKLHMKPGTKAAKVIEILAERPATTSEVAAETNWGRHNSCAHLENLYLKGKIGRKEHQRVGKRIVYLWMLRLAA